MHSGLRETTYCSLGPTPPFFLQNTLLLDEVFIHGKYMNQKLIFRISVRSHASSIDYGSAPVVVTEDMVTVKRLSSKAVVDLEMGLTQSYNNPNELSVLTHIQTTIRHKYQHATLVCHVFFSDDQVNNLSDMDPEHYVLSAWSSNEQILGVSHKSNGEVDLIALDDTQDAQLSLQLKSVSHCAGDDAQPIAVERLLIHIGFNGTNRSGHKKWNGKMLNSTYEEGNVSNEWKTEALVAFLIFLGVVFGVLHLIGVRGRGPLSQGYERLVLPLLSRLSSSGSTGKDENSQEWIWLSKSQLDGFSIGSR
ncbi:hypothetical protein AB6A40_008404 [Gnathostoma spinigerum]|uniref:Transmembrane protein TMEM132 sixth domain-containing protein n=1 Tax=Gnathostoma spinigerum TaxID=75299 RepID=A0ABD6ENZ5_9BILA